MVIPLVTHGITLISRLQIWTQPLWLVLHVAALRLHRGTTDSARSSAGLNFTGIAGARRAIGFELSCSAPPRPSLFSLMAQIGEQVDYLRFLPGSSRRQPRALVGALYLSAGPGWIDSRHAEAAGRLVPRLSGDQRTGAADTRRRTDADVPGRLRLRLSIAAAGAGAAPALFVVVSQLKINVTNAYAGSHRLVELLLAPDPQPSRPRGLAGVQRADRAAADGARHLQGARAACSVFIPIVAVAWIGALVADLVINKPLGLSPPDIEFKRAHLYDINPVGVGAMASRRLLSHCRLSRRCSATMAQAFSPFIALARRLRAAPLIAWATKAALLYRAHAAAALGTARTTIRCSICEQRLRARGHGALPGLSGAICSLCCTLDARCHDCCKPQARVSNQLLAWLGEAAAGASRRAARTPMSAAISACCRCLSASSALFCRSSIFRSHSTWQDRAKS